MMGTRNGEVSMLRKKKESGRKNVLLQTRNSCLGRSIFKRDETRESKRGGPPREESEITSHGLLPAGVYIKREPHGADLTLGRIKG